MAQITRGLINVTNGSATVAGDADALFSTGVPAVAIGDLVKVDGETVFYEVQSIDSDIQITLTSNYGGSTNTGLTYTITQDFYTNLKMIQINKGDKELAEILDRNFGLLDNNFPQSAPASAGAAGTKGQIAFASGYIYICVATNTWQRAAIATW